MPEYIDSDSPYATVTADAALTAGVPVRTTVLTYNVKNGKKGWLLGFRNSISSGGEVYGYFSLLINGVPLENFDRIQNQIAAPENQQGNFLIKKELPQGAELKVVIDNIDDANTYTATAKLEIAYESF